MVLHTLHEFGVCFRVPDLKDQQVVFGWGRARTTSVGMRKFEMKLIRWHPEDHAGITCMVFKLRDNRESEAVMIKRDDLVQLVCRSRYSNLHAENHLMSFE